MSCIEAVGREMTRHLGGGGGSNGEALEECTRISPRFCSCRYDTSGGSGKILRASGT